MFPCRRGVRQGCNLSPLLFCLFLSDLEKFLQDREMKGVKLVHSKLRLLLFADALVLLSETTQDMQRAVDLLNEYCDIWDLKINLIKTKLIPFSNHRTPINPIHILLNGSEIQVVKKYKYLGILLSANGSLKPAIDILAAQANKALFSLMKSATRLQYPSPLILSHLFDSLVRPITEYASEIWTPSESDEMEVLHRRFCKFALELPTSTTNIAVYSDLGRVPLSIRHKVSLLKYWLRITTSTDISPLLLEAYQLLTLNDQPNTWCRKIQRILNEAGFSYVWSNPCEVDPTQFIKAIRQTLHIQYIQEWNGLLTASSKLRTYRLFKNTLKYEPYLNLPPYLRVPLARLRTSAHGLKIETGRYTIPNPTPVEERLCDLCGVTEDEVHFLINCPMTDNNERSNLFSHCTSLLPSFRYKSSRDKFLFIMSCKDSTTLSYLALSVSRAFLSRASRFHN